MLHGKFMRSKICKLNITKMITWSKVSRMRWAEHVARMGEERKV
jgi:hypothetical protein